MKNCSKNLIYFFSILFFLVCNIKSFALENNKYNILLLSSYNYLYIWNNNIINGFGDYFGNNNLAAAIDVFEINDYVNGNTKPKENRIIQEKISSGNYDLIVSIDTQSINFILNKNITIPENIPWLFVGYNYFYSTKISFPANSTGFTLPKNTNENLELGMLLKPKTLKVFMLFGTDVDAEAVKDDIELKLPEYKQNIKTNLDIKTFPDVEVLSGKNITTKEMLSKLANAPQESFVIYESWDSTKDDINKSGNIIKNQIKKTYKGLIFSNYDSATDIFNDGGSSCLGYEAGYEAAERGFAILKGENPAKFLIAKTPVSRTINYNALQRLNIPENLVPAGYTIINRPEKWYNAHGGRDVIFYALTLAVIITLFLIILWLHKSRRIYRRTFGLLPVYTVVFNRNGKVYFAYWKSSDITKKCRNIYEFAPESFLKNRKIIDQVFDRRENGEIEYKIDQNYLRITLQYLGKEQFGEECVMAVSGQINELYDYRRSLAAVSDRFEKTLNGISEGVITTDDKGVITWANPVAAQLIMIDKADMTGRNINEIFKLVSPNMNSNDKLENALMVALREQKGVESGTPADLIKADGKKLHIFHSASPLFDNNNQLSGAVLVFRDITQEINNRDWMYTQNRIMHTASEISDATYFKCGVDCACTYESGYSNKYWRTKNGEPLHYTKWIYQDDVEPFRQAWDDLLTGKTKRIDISYRSDYDGVMRYFDLMVEPSVTPGRGFDGYIGVIRETTKLKEKEASAKEAFGMLNSVMNALPAYIFVKDAAHDFRYIMVNDRYAGIFKKEAKEIIGKTDKEFNFKESEQLFRENTYMVIEGNQINKERRTLTVNGEERTVECYKRLCKLDNGSKFIIGLMLDVTEEVDLENKLEDSAYLMDSIVNYLPSVLWIKDLAANHKYVQANRFYHNMIKYPHDTIIGKTDYDLEFSNAKELCRSDADAYEQGGFEVDEDLIMPGRILHLHTIKVPLRSRNRNEKLLMGIGFDISKIVQMRQELTNNLQQKEQLNRILRKVMQMAEPDKAFKYILEAFGKMLNADHCYTLRYDYEKNLCRVSSYWHNVLANNYNDRNLPVLPLSEKLLHEMSEHEIFHFSTTDDDFGFDENASLLERSSSKDKYILPIRLNGKLWGHLGVSYTRKPHKITDNESQLMFHAEKMLEILIERINNVKLLDRSEFEKQLILDSLEVPLLLFDHNGNLLRGNNAALKFAGCTEKDVQTTPCYKLFCQDSQHTDLCPLRQTKKDGKEHTITRIINGRDFKITCTPIFIDGEIVYMLSSFTDVSDINNLKLQLSDAQEEANRANQAKGFFLATISHELRTPLNAVIGFTELLRTPGMDKSEITDCLNSITAAGNSLLGLINDVLDLSKIEAEHLEIVRRPMVVGKLLNEINTIFRYKANEKVLSFSTSCVKQIPEICLDYQRLRQILINLTGNALKFTETGFVNVIADFEADSTGKKGILTIKVEDSGMGIPAEEQKHIFDPFVQESAVRESKVYGGSGLGLAIAQRLAKKMGGSLTLKSTQGRGSTFTIAIPKVEILERLELAAADAPVAVAVADKPAQSHTPARISKVLVVDDVPMNVKVLSALIKKNNWEVETAESGAEALEKLKTFTPELVLTDIWMPNMNGDILAEHIRANPAWADMAIIAITADAEAKNNFKVQYFNELLLKPVTQPKLAKAIEKVFS